MSQTGYPKGKVLILSNEQNATAATVFARLFYENEFVAILWRWDDFGRHRIADVVCPSSDPVPYRLATELEESRFLAGLSLQSRYVEPIADAPEMSLGMTPEMDPLRDPTVSEVAAACGDYYIEAHFDDVGHACYEVFNKDGYSINEGSVGVDTLYAALLAGQYLLTTKRKVDDDVVLKPVSHDSLVELEMEADGKILEEVAATLREEEMER
jgi:hypothetical protein